MNRLAILLLALSVSALAQQEQTTGAACGLDTSNAKASYYTMCVDFDRIRLFTGMPAYGKFTKVFVTPFSQDVLAVRVTAKRGDEVRSYVAEPFMQPNGKKVAAVFFEGMDYDSINVTTLVEEK